MTPNAAHEPHVVALTVRERLVQIRAEKALVRAPAWLGASKCWMAFAAEACACGCGVLGFEFRPHIWGAWECAFHDRNDHVLRCVDWGLHRHPAGQMLLDGT